MNHSSIKTLQDIILFSVLILINIVLYNNVYAGQTYTEDKYASSTTATTATTTATQADVKVFFSETHGVQVIKRNEIRKVMKSAEMGARIIASPELIEYAKINGIEVKGRTLSYDAVQQMSLRLKRSL